MPKPVDFASEVFHSQKNERTDFGRFRMLQLKNEALKPSCHKENTSERESFQSLRSLPAQEAEGLEGLINLPVFEDCTKRTGFRRLPKTEDSPLKREGTKRIRPNKGLYKSNALALMKEFCPGRILSFRKCGNYENYQFICQ